MTRLTGAALDRAVANAMGLKSVNNCEKWGEEHMTPSEQLHLNAADYAHKKIDTHKYALKTRRMKPLSEEESGSLWVAHYEGYTAGYEANLKEKNT